MNKQRQENELALAIAEWGWQYHHLGIPTNEVREGEIYLPQFKFYVSGFPTSPFGVEWMRFESDSSIPEIIQKIPHLAFEVDDLDFELERFDFNIITKPNADINT